MAQVGLTELRRNFAAQLDRVENDRILPLAELEQLRETLHLPGTPANAKRLLEAAAQIEAGGGSEHDLIEG